MGTTIEKEKKRKLSEIYIKFSLLSEDMVDNKRKKKKKKENELHVFTRQILIPQTLYFFYSK